MTTANHIFHPSEIPIRNLYDVSVIPPQAVCPQVIPRAYEPILSAKVIKVSEEQFSSFFSQNPLLLAYTQPAFYQKATMISWRMAQIDMIGRNNHWLTRDDLLFVSEIIESVLPVCPRSYVWRFKKKQGSGAPRSFVVHPGQGLCYLIQKAVLGIGTCKKAKLAIALPFDTQIGPFKVTCKVSRVIRDRQSVLVPETAVRYDLFRNELMNIMFCPSFPQIFSAFTYRRAESTSSEITFIPKVCVFEEFLSDASKIALKRFREFAQLQFVAQIVDLLAQLGDRIHGDLKPTNVLFECEPSGDLYVKLSDGGFVCRPIKGEINETMRRAFYGCLQHTPPEVWGQNPATVDWYKAEAWALGCCLYFWLYEQNVPWGDEIAESYYKQPLTQDRKDQLVHTIQQIVQTRSNELKTSPPTVFSEIAKLCCELLNVDSAHRMNVQAVHEYIRFRISLGGHPFQKVASRAFIV